ncbi:MAG: hypothetical protein JNM69_20185 [Archangium sp.]|nr:hypothetical protein [Archangium sp.]
MTSSLLSLVLVVAPIQLASVGFTSVKVSKPLVASFEETFALRLSQGGRVRVTTPRDVVTVLGVERQRQLLGCADDSTSCLAELAGALGSEGIVMGEVAQVGRVLQLTIKVLSPGGKPLYSTLRRVKGEEAMLLELDAVALEAVEALSAVLRPVKAVVEAPPVKQPEVVRTPAEPPPPSPSVGPWVVMGVGGAVAIAGGVLQGLAVADFNRLANHSATVEAPAALRDEGKLKQVFGLSLLGAGGAAVIAGALWLALGNSTVAPTAWLTGAGAGFGLVGAW